MARERSPYEGSFDQRLGGSICIGNITSVDSKRRRCVVKTVGLKGVNDDLDLKDVHILQQASHKEGDEETFIPRIGSLAIVAFINSEPYIIGYFQQLAQENDQAPSDKDQLLPGDKIVKTKAGNKMILRSGGTIELESTKLCRQYFIPTSNLINLVCQNYELETDGGAMTWLVDDDTSKTQLRFLVWDTADVGGNTVDIQTGANEDGSVLSIDVGPTSADNTVAEKKFHMDVKPDGTTTVVVNNKCTLSIDPSGNVTLQTEGKLDASVKGNVSVNTDGNTSFTTKGSTTLKSTGSLTVETSATMTLKAPGNPVPGALVTDNAMNVDPITGVPLVGHPQIQVP